MTPWTLTKIALPADTDTVWIRRLRWIDTPVQAIFDLASLTFTSVTTSLVIPAYFVQAWRPL